MAANMIQEASGINNGNSRKHMMLHIVRGVQVHMCGNLSLRIFILLTLSFNTAIKLLSMSTSFGVPPNWVSHLNLHGGVDSGDLTLERQFSKRAVGVGAAALEGCIEFMQGL